MSERALNNCWPPVPRRGSWWKNCALCAGLKELPQHKLGADFAAEVLQRIAEPSPSGREQGEGAELSPAALATSSSDSRHSHPDPLPEGEGEAADAERPTLPLPRFWKSPRGIGWSLVAVAVAVMILVTNRRNDQHHLGDARQGEAVVARAPEPASPPARAPLASQNTRNADVAGVQSGKGQSSGLKPTDGTSELGLDASKSAAYAPKNQPAFDQPQAAPAKNAQLMDRFANDRNDFKKDAEKPADKVLEAPPNTPPAGALAGSQPGGAKLPAGAAASPASSSPAPASVAGGIRLGRAAAAAGAVPEEESLLRQSSADHSDLLVVEVQMSPEAARDRDFERLLAQNKIFFDDATGERASDFNDKLKLNEGNARGEGKESTDIRSKIDASGRAEESAKKSLPPSDRAARDSKPAAERQLDAAELSNELRKLGSLHKSLLERATAANSNFICVDASPQQIDRTIANLRESPQSFLAVTVEKPKELPQLRESLEAEKQVRAAPQSAVNKSLQAPAAGKASDDLYRFQPSDQAQRDQLQQSAVAADEVNRVGPLRGRARRLSPIELQNGAAGPLDLGDKSFGVAGEMKSEDRAKEKSNPVVNEPAASVVEKSPSAPAVARAKQMPADQSRGGTVGGFGGGGGRNTAVAGGNIGGQRNGGSEQGANALTRTENLQRVLFVLRVVDTPPVSAAAKPPDASMSAQPGKSDEKSPEARPAKAPAESK